MRLARPFAALLLLSLAAAPAMAQGRPDAITRLEAARTRNPQNVAALRALGIAYYKAKRYADARPVLDQARRLDPRDGVSALYAGLAAEQVNDLTAARNAYETYLNVGTSRRAKNDIRTRLVALSRQEAVAAAKAAVANEARLSQTPSNPLTVAVPPLRFNGTDSTLKPLERGMADLLITDLSRSARLTVVERDRMQALADEIQLSQSQRVDAQTAVRAGKLIQAGTLVNGTIQQTGVAAITLDASLVNVANGAMSQPASVNNTLDQLFDAEKRLVLQLFQRLNVELTPAERQLVDRRPTGNLQAFLSYSRGLQAADDGRFEDAARYFENARSLDPGFGAASARYQAVQASLTAGAAVSATSIEGGLSGAESRVAEQAAVGNAVRVGGGVNVGAGAAPGGLTTTLENARNGVNPSAVPGVTTVTTQSTTISSEPRLDPTSNTTRTDTPNLSGQVIIIIRRP